jgi:hypothetical protein
MDAGERGVGAVVGDIVCQEGPLGGRRFERPDAARQLIGSDRPPHAASDAAAAASRTATVVEREDTEHLMPARTGEDAC